MVQVALTSLRSRLILGMGVMLLPLVGLMLGAAFLLQSTLDAVEDIEREAAQEIALVIRLQTKVNQALVLVHDFLLGSHNGGEERNLWLQTSLEVDAAFVEGERLRFTQTEERDLLRSAQVAWQEGRRFSARLLAMKKPIRGTG